MKVKSESEVAQLCPTLRNPMDCSLPGCSDHGISQARVLEWGAIAFSMSALMELNSSQVREEANMAASLRPVLSLIRLKPRG